MSDYNMDGEWAADLKTFQDLLEAQKTGREEDVMDFISTAISDHKSSPLYQTAVNAKLYYNGENPTISKVKKVIHDLNGIARIDPFASNHKIKSRFFRFAVDQAVSYLLGNGITLKNAENKSKLGLDFDQNVSKAFRYSQIGGVSFGFWNLDHLEVFQVANSNQTAGFVPLYDEENGALMAGVRFWQLTAEKPMRCTLYEIDGYTNFIQHKGEEMKVSTEKRSYIIHVTSEKAGSDKIYEGENYTGFPIIPLQNDEECRSEISGKEDTIDALDLMRSGMVNNVDEGSIVYWAMKNCGGMNYSDAEKFLRAVKTLHVAFMDNADAGSTVEPHTVEMPVNSAQTAIDMLIKTLHEDFQTLYVGDDWANSATATGIRFRYTNLDLKCDKFEENITPFLKKIFSLAGIDDDPTYTRNRIINTQEEMQTLMLAAPYLDDEYVTTKSLTIMGDADRVEEILKRRAAEDLGRFDGNEPQDGTEGNDGGEN